MISIKVFFNKLFVLIFVSCLSYCVWYFSKPLILSPLVLDNKIEIDMGYENTDHETFDVLFSDNEKPTISYAFGDKGYTQRIDLTIPFIKAKDFKFVFGKEGNIARIDRMSINGYDFSLNELYDSLYKQKFKVGKSKDNNSIYLVSQGELHPYDFDFSNNLGWISENELELLRESDSNIEYCLYAGYFLIFILLYVICSLYIKNKILKTSLSFIASLILIFALIHSFCFLVSVKSIFGLDQAPNSILNLLKFESNLLPLILFALLPYVVSMLFKNIIVKTILQALTLLFILILLIDNFVSVTFLSRFLFEGATVFIVDAKTALSFFLDFINKPNGCFAILSVVLFVFCVFKYMRSTLKKSICYVYFIICFISLIFAYWPFAKSDYDMFFANVFQINGITTDSFGNYYRNYSEDYSYRKNLDFEWKEQKGLNLKKNVIIILAESLSCDLTQMCGTGSDKELAPNLAALAKEYYFFNNYFSDSFSTSMATLNIIKSFPAFPQRNSMYFADNKYTEDLSNKNDLVAAFSGNGYKTAFFSPSDLVFLMDKVLEQTHFDEIFDSGSDIFDKNEKKYVFNAVSDEVLFNSILKYISKQKDDQKIFIMTQTANSHVPYDSPWGTSNFENAFLYSDYAINSFIESLKQLNYFENGIVVITGDHQPWGYSSSKTNRGLFDKNQVPLIIIDKDKSHAINDTTFSHSSLGIYLQSLMLDSYMLNKFNADPIHSSEPPLLMSYELDKQVFAIVKKAEKEARIKFNGDDTEFTSKIFDDDYEHDVLGYLATCGL